MVGALPPHAQHSLHMDSISWACATLPTHSKQNLSPPPTLPPHTRQGLSLPPSPNVSFSVLSQIHVLVRITKWMFPHLPLIGDGGGAKGGGEGEE